MRKSDPAMARPARCCGLRIFRASTIRIYTQANVSLPFYEVSSESWSPVMTFSLGFGWKPEPGHHDSVPWWAFLL